MDLQQVLSALEKADAAGDTQAAQELANLARSLMGGQSTPIPSAPTTSALSSGFQSYAPALQEAYGGLKTLTGVAAERMLGAGDISKSLIESGATSIKEAKAKQEPFATPERTSFSDALDKGVGSVLTEWLPYQVGSGAANILESLAVAGAGAMLGSAAPGIGTVAGGATGLLAKEVAKRGIKEAAEKILAQQGEKAASDFFLDQTKKAAVDVGQKIATTTGLAGMAGVRGAGEVTGRAVEEAEKTGGTASDIELARVAPAAVTHAIAEFVSDKIGLGALEGLGKEGKNYLYNISKNILVTGTKESPTEIVQSMAERYGAKLSLTDATALKEYIDSVAASYAMSTVPGGVGGVRETMAARAAKPDVTPQITPDVEQDLTQKITTQYQPAPSLTGTDIATLLEEQAKGTAGTDLLAAARERTPDLYQPEPSATGADMAAMLQGSLTAGADLLTASRAQQAEQERLQQEQAIAEQEQAAAEAERQRLEQERARAMPGFLGSDLTNVKMLQAQREAQQKQEADAEKAQKAEIKKILATTYSADPLQNFRQQQAAIELIEGKKPQKRIEAPIKPADLETLPDEVKPTAKPTDNTLAGQPTYTAGSVAEVPVANLKLSQDVPQFKSDANQAGVVESSKLEGKFDRRLASPIQVWQRTNGDMEVISGRHRLDLAQRSGEKTIPAQIHKEADGFNADMARMLDIELNVKDGRGKVKDYVSFFKEFGLTKQQARDEGLLNTAIGRQAYEIADAGSPSLIAAHNNKDISDDAAAAIAINAPKDEALQNLGMQQVQNGKSINHAVNFMRSAMAAGFKGQEGSGDLFGFDDSFAKEAEAVTKEATKQQREARQQLSAIKGAAKSPEKARLGGVDVRNLEQTQAKIADLEKTISELENFHTNPELYKKLRQSAGLEEVLTAPTPEELRAKEARAKTEEKRIADEKKAAEDKAKADAEISEFGLTGSESPRDADANQGDMFSLRGKAAEQVSAFEQSLRTLLNKFGLKEIGLKLSEGMRDEGSYAAKLIQIAADSANPIRTLRHEAIHALRELGFFTDAQWNSLSKMAKDKWIDQYLKQRNIDGKPLKAGEESRYDAYMREYKGDMEKITEEAVADAFADFDATKPPAGMIQAILQKMRNLFQSIKSALTKMESAEQIFGKVEKGALKAGTQEATGEKKSLGKRLADKYKMAGAMVDGREVRDDVPNMSSIASSLEDYTVLDGVREVPLSDFSLTGKSYSVSETKRIENLANLISESGEINPLIVVIDNEGSYILEGGHRSEALFRLGAKSFPAIVVLDNESLSTSAAPKSAESKSLRDRATANFKRWFGDSKVVDENGEPLVVYHGTVGKINSFKPGVYRGGTISFAYDKDYAMEYAQGAAFSANEKNRKAGIDQSAKPNVEEVYLSIQNPFEPTKENVKKVADRLNKNGETAPSYFGTWEKALTAAQDDVLETNAVVKAMKEVGFDGQIVQDGFTGNTIVNVFEPTQIKSATSNNGEYSLTDADIRKSLRDRAKANFNRWFADSKVVDKKGEPLVMYHGTPFTFTAFDRAKSSSGMFGTGFYFTDNRDMAKDYAERGNVMEVYLSIKNPAPKNVANEVVDTIGEDDADGIRAELERRGYDGVMMQDGNDLLVVAFNPTQIKSATDNNGEYSLTDADIRKSLRSTAEKTKEKAQQLLQKRAPINVEALSDVDPEYVARLGRVFNPQSKTIIDKIEGMKDGFWRRAAQGLADQYRTIKDYDMRSYMLARMSKTVDGGLEGLMFHGHVFNDGGALNIKKNTKGLMEALKPVGNETDRYMMWIALNREANLPEGKRSPEISALVADKDQLTQGTLNGKPRLEVYKSVQKDMNALNKSVLDIALDMGLINSSKREIAELESRTDISEKKKAERIAYLQEHPGAYERFTSDLFYIPFYKQMEDGDIESAVSSAGLTSQKFSAELKGMSDKPFADLMENTLRNWSHILSASMKNQAANSTINATMKAGATIPNMKVGLAYEDGKVVSTKTGELVGDGKLRPEYTESGKGMVKIMQDGQPMYFEVLDPMLLDSITSIGYMGPKSKFLDVARDFKNMLQFGVTVSPIFKTNNLIRDSISSMAVSDLKKNPFANVIEGWGLAGQNNPAHIEALAGGAIFNFGSTYEGDQAKLVKRLLKQGVKEEHILDTKDKIEAGLKGLWDKYQELGNKSEAANRLALYKQLRDKGMSHLEASFQARDLMDFSMQGSWPAFRTVTMVVPFLNARVQGLYKLGRDGIVPTSRVLYNTITGKPIDYTDKQKAYSFGLVTTSVSLASMALYLAFKDDEEFKKRDEWDRDNFWWIKLPNMDYALRVPKPFEIGAFGTMVERVLEQILDEGAEGKQFGESLSRMLFDTFAMNPVPQMFKPLLDLYANKDSFTGAPIESAGMERLSKQERMTEQTSPLAKALGGMSQILGEKGELSPAQVDYAIKGYFGWLGSMAATTSMYATMPFKEGAYPDTNWMDKASLGLVRTLPAAQSKYSTAFYEANKEISQAFADMRHYAEIGDSEKVQKILEEKQDKIALNKLYDKTAKNMAKVRLQIRVVMNDDTMDGASKKEEIERLKQLISMMAEQAEEVRKSMK